MLVTMVPILEKARKEGYGVVAPTVMNEDQARAAILAAVTKKSPVIIDINGNDNPDFIFLSKITAEMARDVNVPVAINLDHGGSFEVCVKALRGGFTSIMADRSKLSFEENVEQCKELAKIAHAAGLSIEAELGHVGKANEYDEHEKGLTRVEEAKSFIEQTGVDALAVAIGTAHGAYPKGVAPHIDFELLRKLRNEVRTPLVLHGGSGSGDDNLQKATMEGITKVNVGTDNFTNGAEYAMKIGISKGVKKFVFEYNRGYQDSIMRYMDLFHSSGRGAI